MTAILMIEDNHELLKIVSKVLALHDFRVIPALDGASGLQQAFEEAPALILCDLHLPDMNGYEVLMRLREQPATAQTPVIFVTGDIDFSPPEDDNVRILAKPFKVEALLALVPGSV